VFIVLPFLAMKDDYCQMSLAFYSLMFFPQHDSIPSSLTDFCHKLNAYLFHQSFPDILL